MEDSQKKLSRRDKGGKVILLNIKKIQDDVEYRIAEKKYIKINGVNVLGIYTMFSVDAQDIPFIQFGIDSWKKEEIDEILEIINHEYLHFLLWKLGECSNSIDGIYYMYDDTWEISTENKLYLKGLSIIGIGFPEKYAIELRKKIKEDEENCKKEYTERIESDC